MCVSITDDSGASRFIEFPASVTLNTTNVLGIIICSQNTKNVSLHACSI